MLFIFTILQQNVQQMQSWLYILKTVNIVMLTDTKINVWCDTQKIGFLSRLVLGTNKSSSCVFLVKVKLQYTSPSSL